MAKATKPVETVAVSAADIEVVEFGPIEGDDRRARRRAAIAAQQPAG